MIVFRFNHELATDTASTLDHYGPPVSPPCGATPESPSLPARPPAGQALVRLQPPVHGGQRGQVLAAQDEQGAAPQLADSPKFRRQAVPGQQQ